MCVSVTSSSFTSLVFIPHLTLQVVSLFGPFHLHVIRKHRVFVQLCPVVLIAGQRLRVFSRHQVDHIRGQVVPAAGGQRIPAVLLVAGQPAGLQAVQQVGVLCDAPDADVFPLLQQVVVLILVLQRNEFG